MPCIDGRDDEPRVVHKLGHDPHYQQMYNHEKDNNAKLQARVDELANLLCQTGRARRNKTDIPGPVLEWWRAHCELDRTRGEPR